MGAVPKKKPSKTQARHRHTAWQKKFNLPTLQECPECGKMKQTHRVCISCGMYNGRQVIDPKTQVKKAN